MNTIARKINQFNKLYNKEEKMLIVLGSLVTLFTIILGFMAIVFLMQKYIEFTAPHVAKALDALVGALFEGWTMF